jgi:hypothetical protein
MRVKVSVNIDKEVYEKAHSLGINVSKASENYLRMLIQSIESAQNPAVLNPCSSQENGVVRSPRFEPGSSAWQATVSSVGDVDWVAFRWFVEADHRPRVASQLCSNAEKYASCLFKRDFSQVQALDVSVRKNVMSGLSALSKFLGCYGEFKGLVKAYDLQWVGKNADAVFIERMTKTQSHDEVWVWIREVKVNHPALEAFMDLISVSGMRLSEAVNSYNLIVKLAGEKKLDTYFNGEKGWLEHFHFPDLFIRDSKKTFVSFVPFELVEKISKVQALGGVRLKGEVNRFSDIRELHATFMTRFLKKEEIDFLHGRVTSGVFMQNYFNPSLISDLKARAFQGIAEIQEKIKT